MRGVSRGCEGQGCAIRSVGSLRCLGRATYWERTFLWRADRVVVSTDRHGAKGRAPGHVCRCRDAACLNCPADGQRHAADDRTSSPFVVCTEARLDHVCLLKQKVSAPRHCLGQCKLWNCTAEACQLSAQHRRCSASSESKTLVPGRQPGSVSFMVGTAKGLPAYEILARVHLHKDRLTSLQH